ncbi:MAG: integration host factor subunit alpha [Desulfobulbaceae bacterium]|nr:integration host factor subunit alpha [Desulfobulbaceae bacterium]
MTLTKADLVHKVYESQDVSKVQATDAVEAFLRISKGCLENGNNLLLSGFGKFTVKEKKERRGRNPQTGDALMLEARTVVTFKPSGILRDRING